VQQADIAAPQILAARPAPAHYLARLWTLLPDEGPTITLRLVCYLAALACFSVAPTLHTRGLVLGPRIGAALTVISLVAGLLCFYLASRATLPRWLEGVRPRGRTLLIATVSGALCASVVSAAVLATLPLTVMRPHHYANDAVTATDCATSLIMRGHNPYTEFDMGACLTHHDLTALQTTPLQAGAFARTPSYPAPADLTRVFAQARRDHVRRPAAFESFFNYPAGAFLLPAAFVALGWSDLSSFYLLWAVLAYGLLALRAPRRWRPWLLALAGGNVTLWGNAADGQSNLLVIFLILAGWSTWQRPWLSSALIGLALATRQEAWFFAPYYLILVGRLGSWRGAAARLAVVAVVCALINAPFIVLSSGAWLHGVLGPLRDPMYPLGEGVIALATSGALPLWSRAAYTGLELAALVLCLLIYLRTCRRHPGTGLVLALVPLVFAWRSLFTYFYVALPLLCLWVILADLAPDRSAWRVDRAQAPERTRPLLNRSDDSLPAAAANKRPRCAGWRDRADAADATRERAARTAA